MVVFSSYGEVHTIFESLFTYASALRRHREGPLAAERAAYLLDLATRGMAPETILHRARYCLCVAIEIERRPPDRCFDEEEIWALASAWAQGRVAAGRAQNPRWPEEQFRFAALDFLRWLRRLRPAPEPETGRYDERLDDFIAAQQQGPWQSEATCRAGRWQIRRFLDYLEQRGTELAAVSPDDVDAYFRHMAQRWGRVSLRTSAKMLRAWVAYCPSRGWTPPGLADAILLARIYRHEGLPLGPTWEEIGRMLADTAAGELRKGRCCLLALENQRETNGVKPTPCTFQALARLTLVATCRWSQLDAERPPQRLSCQECRFAPDVPPDVPQNAGLTPMPLVDLSGVNDVDAVAVHTLDELVERYRARRIRFAFASMKGPVRDVFTRARWAEAHPDALGYVSLEHALRSVRGEPEPSRADSA